LDINRTGGKDELGCPPVQWQFENWSGCPSGMM